MRVHNNKVIKRHQVYYLIIKQQGNNVKKLLIIILATGGLLVTNAVSQAQENVTIVTGEIVSVKLADRTMTIKGNARGQNNVYQVPETMKILKNGREISLRALNPGDLIEAKYFVREDVRVLTNLDYTDPEGLDDAMAQVAPAAGAMNEAPEEMAEEEVLPTVLPKTASTLPLYGMMGFILLSFAGLLRVARAKYSK